MHDLTIRPLGECTDLIELTVAWHMPEFDPHGDVDFWLTARIREAREGGVPCAWVALAGPTPVGSVSLIENNMETHPQLTPWLAALFVLPEHRNQGIGRALVRHCEREASTAGFATLYLFTSTARDYYARLGWVPILEGEPYENVLVTVMKRELRIAAD
ncbi:MAG TPA: GNAT family N-acetyltransferase [Actinomycetota bacterium]|nr:GNAT family N-acetyltransferase [Actinomycetota bacterium]